VAHNILSQCDQCLAAYLISVGAGNNDDVYPAKRAEDKTFPDTICWSSKARLITPNSAVYVVSAIVQVRTDPCVDVNQSVDDTVSASKDRVAATFDAFWAGVGPSSAGLAAAITDAGRGAGLSDFTVQSCIVLGMESGFDAKGNAWTDTIDLELVCCPNTIS